MKSNHFKNSHNHKQTFQNNTNALVLHSATFINEFDLSDTEPSLVQATTPNSGCMVPANPAEVKKGKKKQINDTHDKGLSEESPTNALVNKKRRFVAQHFFTLSLLDYVCHFTAKNEFESEYMFKAISSKMVEYNLMPSEFTQDTFKSLRLQYNEMVRAIISSIQRSPLPMLTYVPNESNANIKRKSFSTSSNATSISANPAELLHSRYAKEFAEKHLIGNGGFGCVYAALNNLDQKLYAIKKINFQSHIHNLREKILREIELLSSLNHPNIVSYHNCWLESSFRSLLSEAFSRDTTKTNESKNFDHAKHNFDDVSKISEESFSLNDDQDGDKSCSSSSRGFFRKPTSTYTQDTSLTFSETESELVDMNQNFDDSNSVSHERNRVAAKDQAVLSHGEFLVLYIQLQLCDCTLKNWICDRNDEIFHGIADANEDIGARVDSSLVLNIFRQILDGVNYIHSKGIIHRDLKPSNIFLMKDTMQIKIGDFGLACMQSMLSKQQVKESKKLTDSNANEYGDEHTQGIGTTCYASPEQLMQKNYDKSTDIYSLGIILFELFCPFRTEMERSLCIDKLKKSSQFPNSISKHWPRECEIIKSMISKDPKSRPSTLELMNDEKFMNKEEIISSLRKLLNSKMEEVNKLKSIVKRKDEIIEEQKKLINELSGISNSSA